MTDVLWSGHVRVIQDDQAKTHIIFRKDRPDEPTPPIVTDTAASQYGVTYEGEGVYTPDGFFENKAVNGLVKQLKG